MDKKSKGFSRNVKATTNKQSIRRLTAKPEAGLKLRVSPSLAPPVKQPAAAIEGTAPHNAALHNNVPEVPGEVATVDKDVTVVSTDQSTELIDVPTAPAIAGNLPHDPTNGSDCGPSQNNKVSVPELELAEASPEGQSAPAKEVTAAAADPALQPADVPIAPATAEVPADDLTAAVAVANNEGRNGDETDVRMDEIRKILEHANMPVLDQCAYYAEWVHYAEAKESVPGQNVSKPQGGRPKGGIARAAEELPIPAKNEKARQKFIRRAIAINGISAEAKAAARAAGLANIQSALLSIAKEKTPDAQLAKVKEIADQRAAPRRSHKADKQETTGRSIALPTHDPADLFELSETARENWTAEDGQEFDALLQTWLSDGVLRQAEWQKASAITRRRFARHVLFGANEVEADPADQTSSTTEFPTAPTEGQPAGPASADASAEVPASSSEEAW